MSQVSDELGERLARVVPQLEPLDWDDVTERSRLLRRVPAKRRHGRLRVAPRVLLFAAIVVLMGGSLAVAFGGRVLDAVSGGSAPPHVKQEFKQLVRPVGVFGLVNAPPVPAGARTGRVVRGSERRVLRVRTSLGTEAALYVARTTKGLQCFIALTKPFGVRGCVKPATGVFPLHVWGRRSARAKGVGSGPRFRREWTMLGEAASARAAVVRLVYPGGGHDDFPVAGRWFMFEVPEAHTTLATGPVRMEAFSASGAALGSIADPFQISPRHVVGLTRPVPSSVEQLAQATLPNHGGVVQIASGRDAGGHVCFRHLRNGSTTQFPPWDCTAWVGSYGYALSMAHVPVEWDLRLRTDMTMGPSYGFAYAIGWVAPGITRLTLQFQAGGSTEIPLHRRFYLYVVPKPHWPSGRRPSVLVARNGRGAVVYRRFLYPTEPCIYPATDPRCKFSFGTG
jgi:hypothetical protein